MGIASHWGVTLPGMIELPGPFSGMLISPSPERGPEAGQRTSAAIFQQRGGYRLERAMGMHEGVVRG